MMMKLRTRRGGQINSISESSTDCSSDAEAPKHRRKRVDREFPVKKRRMKRSLRQSATTPSYDADSENSGSSSREQLSPSHLAVYDFMEVDEPAVLNTLTDKISTHNILPTVKPKSNTNLSTKSSRAPKKNNILSSLKVPEIVSSPVPAKASSLKKSLHKKSHRVSFDDISFTRHINLDADNVSGSIRPPTDSSTPAQALKQNHPCDVPSFISPVLRNSTQASSPTDVSSQVKNIHKRGWEEFASPQLRLHRIAIGQDNSKYSSGYGSIVKSDGSDTVEEKEPKEKKSRKMPSKKQANISKKEQAKKKMQAFEQKQLAELAELENFSLCIE